MNILRRLSPRRLLLLCALVVALGISATALAFALSTGPTPPPKPLADAIHDALAAPAVEGVSARIQLTDHLLEGANLTSEGGQAGELASGPLLAGASGRLWIAKDGRVRVELQAEKGDTQILYDGHTVSMYDAATNTLYRDTLPKRSGSGEGSGASPDSSGDQQATPSVAKIDEAIASVRKHANLSGATPTDVAGQAAYTVRISPNEGGSLIGGAELSFDAVHGVPLRAAIYSSTSSSPVIELAATEISYGHVADSVFQFTPPAGVKIEEPSAGDKHALGAHSAPGFGSSLDSRRGDRVTGHAGSQRGTHPSASARHTSRPKLRSSGHGLAQITVLESKTKGADQESSSTPPEGLPKVQINGTSATELATALGTLLTFERSGVRYLLVGSVTPAAIEAVARGL